MKENQHIEWKETWRDEFLRWVCGFANAAGGVLREAVLNALVHRDYATGAPVQIRVYDDRLSIWNPAVLPDGWTVKNLIQAHASTPFNPAIANVFFRSGEIETWGRGIERIFAACKDAGAPKPRLTFDGTGLRLEFRYTLDYLKAVSAPEGESLVAEQVTPEVTPEVGKLLAVITSAHSRKELQGFLRLRDDDHMRVSYLDPALAAGLIERTLPDKPNSRLQKYRLTAHGRAWLIQHPQ